MRPIAAAALLVLGSLHAQETKVSDKALKKAVAEQDRKGFDAAVKDLAAANSVDAMKILLAWAGKAPPEDAWWIESYAALLTAAASFTDSGALGELAQFIVRNAARPLGRDALAMVCNRGHKEVLGVCVKVLESSAADDLKILAADHLVAVGDRSVVDALIKGLKAAEKGSPDLRHRLARALTVITGQDYGESVSNWEGWWTANREKELEVKEGDAGASTGTVTDGFDRSRRSEFEKLQKTGRVLVLGAGDKCKCGKPHDLDRIDSVTSRMGLQTDFVTKLEFDLPAVKPEDYVAILANCTHIREHCACPDCKPGNYSADRLYQCVCPKNVHIPVKYVLSDKGVAKLKAYVEKGGYLFAEDWCMEDFMERAFGDYVAHGSVRAQDESVAVFPKPGATSHPYLRKIFFKPPTETRDTLTEGDLTKIAHKWKIDKETRTIKVKDAQKVVTLLTSPDLEKYAQGDDAVAVTFGVDPAAKGKPATPTGEISQDRKKMTGGRVLYVLSHFGKQNSQEDEYALQNLLVNFLVEANERRSTFAPPASKKK
jgi:hypothetical protein